MEGVVKGSISELARHLNAQPGSEAELFAVFNAARVGGQVNELVRLLDLWSQAEQGPGLSERTMAELYFILATKCSGAQARELSRTALDWFPAHFAALSLFEGLVDVTWHDELCARYLTFIEDAPIYGVSPETCSLVHEKLIRAEQEAALGDGGHLPSAPAGISEAPTGLRLALR